MKTAIDQFCEGCRWYKPDWDAEPKEDGSLPCNNEHVCKKNAKIAEVIHDGK